MIEPTLVYRLRLASVTLRERYDLVVATWHLNSPPYWMHWATRCARQRLYWVPNGYIGALSLCLSGPTPLASYGGYLRRSPAAGAAQAEAQGPNIAVGHQIWPLPGASGCPAHPLWRTIKVPRGHYEVVALA